MIGVVSEWIGGCRRDRRVSELVGVYRSGIGADRSGIGADRSGIGAGRSVYELIGVYRS